MDVFIKKYHDRDDEVKISETDAKRIISRSYTNPDELIQLLKEGKLPAVRCMFSTIRYKKT